MTTLREAAQQALEALEWIEPSGLTGRGGIESRSKAITALRAALAAPEERNFCPRCGKRTNGIHTCTPP